MFMEPHCKWQCGFFGAKIEVSLYWTRGSVLFHAKSWTVLGKLFVKSFRG